MDYTELLEKLGSTPVDMSPAMADVMQRVREVGLHKVAAYQHGVPEFNLKVAAQIIGTQLAIQHLRFSKVASGIRALHSLDAAGEIQLEKRAVKYGPPMSAGQRMALQSMLGGTLGAGTGAAVAGEGNRMEGALLGGGLGAGAAMGAGAMERDLGALASVLPLGPMRGVPRGKGQALAAALGGAGGGAIGGMIPEKTAAVPGVSAARSGANAVAKDAKSMFAGAAGASPFSGTAHGMKRAPMGPPTIPGKTSPGLETLMNNLGSKERGALGQAFGVAPEAVTPPMYMRAAHKAASLHALDFAKMAAAFA